MDMRCEVENVPGETILKITEANKLLEMQPSAEDFKKYDVVFCSCLYVFHPKRQIEEELAKICYLARKKVMIDLLVEDSKPDEHSWGKKGKVMAAGTSEQGTVMTTLRLTRRLNDFCFVIVNELKGDGLRRIYTARRMPEVKWDGTTPLWEYPEHTVVIVPLIFKDWRGFYARIDKERDKWVKHERVEQLMKEFKPWLYVPIYFCRDTKHVRQGAHRLEVARRIGDKTIKVRIMRTWWKKFSGGGWIEDPDITHWKNNKPLKWLEDHKVNDGKVKGEGT